MRLAGTVALVTGGSSGIGRAVAGRLADAGASVLVHGRDVDRTLSAAADVGGTGIVADLRHPHDRDRLVEDALRPFGRVDVLVANAGVGWAGAVTTMPADLVRDLLEVDLVAPVELTHRLLPGMVARGCGSVVYVTSVAGRVGVAGEAVYAAAKAGLDAFAESLRAEAIGTGVHVGVVVPGAVRTDFFGRRGRPYERRWPRPVEPDAVAALVVQAIEEGRPEIWVPRWLQAAAAVRAVAPSGYRRLSARFGEQQRLDVPRANDANDANDADKPESP